MIDDNGSPSTADQDVIGSATSVEDILHALAARNCPDLTSTINNATCSNLPVTGGGFCDVYQGTLNPGSKIAIKSLRLYDKPGREDEKEKLFKRAARELYYWSKLKHPNVLPLMGLAMFRGRLSMVSEWMENGSLMSYVMLNHPSDQDRIGLCLDVGAGLSYLHANDMVHGDLKAANVMVSPGGIGMIADFGNSQLKEITLKFTNTTSSSLSVRWAAPELFKATHKPQVSKKSDVYAYGMTALETLTGKIPYDGVGDRKVLSLVALNRHTPARPAIEMSDGIWEILQLCWRWEPSDRPDMLVIEKRLRDIYFRSWIEAKNRDNPGAFTHMKTSLVPAPEASRGAASTDAPTSHMLWLQSILHLAVKYREAGRLAEAESLGAEVLTTQKRVLGVGHPDTLNGMANLAVIYREQGQLAKAEGIEVEEVAFRKQVLGGGHPETIRCMANLAASYHDQGRLAESEPLWVEIVATQKRVLGEDHPETLSSMANLATTYHGQNRPAEAELLWVEIVATQKRVLGEDHPETLSSMANLATTYHGQSRPAEAELLWVEIVATQKRVLGEDHPETLSSMANLATTYHGQSRPAEAEPLWVEIVAARKLLLGEDHPDTLSSMANLAVVYHEQGRLAEAEPIWVKVVATQKQVLGTQHPDTLSSVELLAFNYRERGRWAKAEPLEAEVLASRTLLLGEDHLETVSSMANLARIYYEQGRLAEAQGLWFKVVDARKLLLGEDDPQTHLSMINLANIYRKQRLNAEAEAQNLESRAAPKRRDMPPTYDPQFFLPRPRRSSAGHTPPERRESPEPGIAWGRINR